MAPGENHGISWKTHPRVCVCSQMRLALCGFRDHQNVRYQESAGDKAGCAHSPENLH